MEADASEREDTSVSLYFAHTNTIWYKIRPVVFRLGN